MKINNKKKLANGNETNSTIDWLRWPDIPLYSAQCVIHDRVARRCLFNKIQCTRLRDREIEIYWLGIIVPMRKTMHLRKAHFQSSHAASIGADAR